MATQLSRRRFTVEDYDRMAEAGILTEDERVELIAGEIIEMAAIGARHMTCVNRLTMIIARHLAKGLTVSIQNPVRLSNESEPEPDISVIHDRNYAIVPAPSDVFLVMEVADSSREYDRGIKMPLYAAAGIAEAWLVDLVAEMIERYTDPHNGHYRLVAIAHRGETLASTVFPALVIDVDTVLGQ